MRCAVHRQFDRRYDRAWLNGCTLVDGRTIPDTPPAKTSTLRPEKPNFLVLTFISLQGGLLERRWRKKHCRTSLPQWCINPPEQLTREILTNNCCDPPHDCQVSGVAECAIKHLFCRIHR